MFIYLAFYLLFLPVGRGSLPGQPWFPRNVDAKWQFFICMMDGDKEF